MRLPSEDATLRGPLLGGRLLRVAVADDDRAAVVGDTLRRVAARSRVTVSVARGGPDRMDLNVPPGDGRSWEEVDVAVGAVDVAAAHRVDVPPWSRPAQVGGDPLAVRLLLLGTPLAADVEPGRLTEAADELTRWRRRLGAWAREPSAAPPADAVAAVVAALDDGLDAPRALALLRALETDERVRPGARMEAFLTLDRLLGLDLALGLVSR